jgi:hypothetical protein
MTFNQHRLEAMTAPAQAQRGSTQGPQRHECAAAASPPQRQSSSKPHGSSTALWFSEGDDFEPMNPVYFKMRFRTDQPVIDWPSEFAILSAYATTGQSWTPDQNEAADRRLESELRTRGGWLGRIFGYSPTSGHTEPRWAIDCLCKTDAASAGASFRTASITSRAMNCQSRAVANNERSYASDRSESESIRKIPL